MEVELRRLQTQLIQETEASQQKSDNQQNKPSQQQPKCYEVKINNHGWDQTDKFVKIYVPLQNVQSLPAENVVCKYTDRSVHLRVLGLDNRNHDLLINNLCEEIVPENSSVKVKNDNIIVSLAKKVCKNWSFMTEVEKRLKESKNTVPQMDKDDDPSASMMNIMKKMYNEGDDDMKRMIAKAWTESQDKRGQGMDLP